jgi:hypothetical protein
MMAFRQNMAYPEKPQELAKNLQNTHSGRGISSTTDKQRSSGAEKHMQENNKTVGGDITKERVQKLSTKGRKPKETDRSERARKTRLGEHVVANER